MRKRTASRFGASLPLIFVGIVSTGAFVSPIPTNTAPKVVHSPSNNMPARRQQRPLPSLSSPHQEPPIQARQAVNQAFKDAFTLIMYTLSCVAVAFGISLYQDLDCSALKPNGNLRERALNGMGQQAHESDIIPSYNTVLQHHRDWRVNMWKTTALDVDEAIATIVSSLVTLDKLKSMATNYQWDDMQQVIRSSGLREELEEACAVLRKAAPTTEARDEIGFDWGSCAWRHCGAQADAQEALAELYNLIGVLEPFECLFCIDIVERSLHDILAVYSVKDAPEYIPYVARGQEDQSALDLEYVETLEGLRNQVYE